MPSRAQDLFATTFEQEREMRSKLTNPIAALIEQERTMRSKLTAPIEALIEQGQETPHRFSVVRHPLAPGYVGLESTVKSWWFSSKAWPVAEDPTAVGSITYVHNHYHHYYYCSSVNVHGDNVGAIRIDHGANADTTDRPR